MFLYLETMYLRKLFTISTKFTPLKNPTILKDSILFKLGKEWGFIFFRKAIFLTRAILDLLLKEIIETIKNT